jgi:hypothetical protein
MNHDRSQALRTLANALLEIRRLQKVIAVCLFVLRRSLRRQTAITSLPPALTTLSRNKEPLP